MITVGLSTLEPQPFAAKAIWLFSICKMSKLLLISFSYNTILVSGVDTLLQERYCFNWICQKRASRWICNSKFNSDTYSWDPPSGNCLAQLKGPSISTRFVILSLMFLHDLLYQKLSINFSDYFQFRNSSTRSHRLSLMCKHSRINVYRYSFFVNIIYLWNKLPYSTASLSDLRVFNSVICNYFGFWLYMYFCIIVN